jgi:putative hydrolase of HD superfamily
MSNTSVEDSLSERLQRQLAFFRELDRLKRVFRRSWHLDKSRHENDAEHSWHVAVMVMVFREYAKAPSLDYDRIIRMLLIHDVVEIDAGDTFAYDDAGLAGKRAREMRAADRLFAMLPEDQHREFRSLWEEFDRMSTPEGCFAGVLDRIQPLLHN